MPTARSKQVQLIQQERRQIARELGAQGEILKGSLLERFTVCSRPGCRCLDGEKHGPYLYLSVFDGKQSRHVYVPHSMESQVRRWVRNARQLTEKVAILTALNVKLIRQQSPKKEALSIRRRSPKGRKQGAR